MKRPSLEKKKQKIEELKAEIEIARLKKQLKGIETTGNEAQKPGKEGSNKNLEELLVRIEERTKRQEDWENILMEKLSINEEMMAEMKKNIENLERLSFSLLNRNDIETAEKRKLFESLNELQKGLIKVKMNTDLIPTFFEEANEKLSQMEEKQEKLRKTVESQKDMAKFFANTAPRESGKVDEVNLLAWEILEERKMKREMEEKRKMEEQQRKREEEEKRKQEEEDRKRAEEVGRRIETERKIKEEELKWRVDPLLTGNLEALKGNIHFDNNEIVLGNESLYFKEFQKIVDSFQTSIFNTVNSRNALSSLHNPLWILTPEDYEVECRGYFCHKMIPLVPNICEDLVSVLCPHCSDETSLGDPKEGFRWVKAGPCNHIQQLKNGERPGKCVICGENFWFKSGQEELARTPRRKYTEYI